MRQHNIDVESTRLACSNAYRYFQEARADTEFADGALIEFLRLLFEHPELLFLERHWVKRNKDLDRELYGITKWCDPKLEFGLNVWNRNHFNPIRKAQWPWKEVVDYADWVKPIVYQHQSGQVYVKEMTDFHKSILRDFTPEEFTPIMYKILGINEIGWDDLVSTGMDATSYVGGQCKATVDVLQGKLPVYMGIGVDAPRVVEDQAKCTPEIVYDSVLATYNSGGAGVIFSPNYSSMNLKNLDGAARALKEIGVWQ
jgi:hypothetical protein